MSDSIIDFEQDHEFFMDGQQVVPNTLRSGDIVTIDGTKGLFKVTGKRWERKKLVIECEKIVDNTFFRVQWEENREVYGVEAICRETEMFPREYLITHRGRKRWVQHNDCVMA